MCISKVGGGERHRPQPGNRFVRVCGRAGGRAGGRASERAGAREINRGHLGGFAR